MNREVSSLLAEIYSIQLRRAEIGLRLAELDKDEREYKAQQAYWEVKYPPHRNVGQLP